jgi:diguanylate cyclase
MMTDKSNEQEKRPRVEIIEQSLPGLDPDSPPDKQISLEKILEMVAFSHEIARRILPLLSEKNIPVTPNNYRLFYEYFMGTTPALKEILDRMLEKGVQFTPRLTQTLYSRFFSLEATETYSQAVGRARNRLQNMTGDVSQALTDILDKNKDYGGHLDVCMNQLKDATSRDHVRRVVTDLMDQTDQVRQYQENLSTKLGQVTQELNRLQAELDKREELANTDELTRIYNRRAFNIRLNEETNRARRHKTELSLIMLDLDDFKLVNDTYGHLVGDRLLCITAGTLGAYVRGFDCLARYGGEEFAVVCPQTDLRDAVGVADRLRAAVGDTYFTVGGEAIAVTISAGVARFRPEESIEELVQRADQSMYLAKRIGKNTVCSEDDLAKISG